MESPGETVRRGSLDPGYHKGERGRLYSLEQNPYFTKSSSFFSLSFYTPQLVLTIDLEKSRVEDGNRSPPS